MTTAIGGAALTTASSDNTPSASRARVSFFECAVLNCRELLLQKYWKLIGACFLIGDTLVNCREGDMNGQGSTEEHCQF